MTSWANTCPPCQRNQHSGCEHSSKNPCDCKKQGHPHN